MEKEQHWPEPCVRTSTKCAGKVIWHGFGTICGNAVRKSSALISHSTYHICQKGSNLQASTRILERNLRERRLTEAVTFYAPYNNHTSAQLPATSIDLSKFKIGDACSTVGVSFELGHTVFDCYLALHLCIELFGLVDRVENHQPRP